MIDESNSQTEHAGRVLEKSRIALHMPLFGGSVSNELIFITGFFGLFHAQVLHKIGVISEIGIWIIILLVVVITLYKGGTVLYLAKRTSTENSNLEKNKKLTPEKQWANFSLPAILIYVMALIIPLTANILFDLGATTVNGVINSYFLSLGLILLSIIIYLRKVNHRLK